MTKPLQLISIVILCFGILLSCEKQNNREDVGTDKESIKDGGTIVIGINNDVDSFNPLFGETVSAQEITHLMLLGLTDLDEHSNFKPEIARSWRRSEDYKKLIYTLRRDAVWSDGRPITAYDVKFTYNLLMNPDVASPRQGVTEFIERVTAVDSFTVAFEFSKAYPAQIFDTAGEILPSHILKDVDPRSLKEHVFGRQPLSSGPFKLKKWVKQQYIELVPNDRYFGKTPFFDRVIFKIVPDQTNLLMQLKSGEIDMMSDIPLTKVQNLKRNHKHITLHKVSGRVYYYIGYNQKHTLFTNRSVRRALTMAIDRAGMIEGLLHGFGRKCLGPLPPIVQWAYTEKVDAIPYDTEKARSLLAESGWKDSDGDEWLDKNGKTFEFDLICPAGNQIKSDVAIVVQQQLAQVGIKVHIKMMEWTHFLKRLKRQNFEACVGGLSTSYYIDPTPVFHSKSTHLFNNISYSNPVVDRLIERGRQEMDRAEAAKIWARFQKTVYQDQPFTFLFWIDKVVGVHKRFQNVSPIALSSVYDLEYWYVNKGR